MTNIEAAIVDLAAGKRTVQVSVGGRFIRFAEVDIDKLRALRAEIAQVVGGGTLRTYAKQGGRC